MWYGDDGLLIYKIVINYSSVIVRVAVGMGIPIGISTGPTCGWEWEIFLAYGNSHMWESYGKSSFPHVGILWEIVIPIYGNPMGIPTEILWEWDGNGNENSLPTATLVIVPPLTFQYMVVASVSVAPHKI